MLILASMLCDELFNDYFPVILCISRKDGRHKTGYNNLEQGW